MRSISLPYSFQFRVWCARMSGCDGRLFRECWLKDGTLQDVIQNNGFSHECEPEPEMERSIVSFVAAIWPVLVVLDPEPEPTSAGLAG